MEARPLPRSRPRAAGILGHSRGRPLRWALNFVPAPDATRATGLPLLQSMSSMPDTEDAKLWPHLHQYGSGSLYSEPGSGGMYRFVQNRLLLVQSGFRANNLYAFWFLNRCIAKARWRSARTPATHAPTAHSGSFPPSARSSFRWSNSGADKGAGRRTSSPQMHSHAHLAPPCRTAFPSLPRGGGYSRKNCSVSTGSCARVGEVL
jgi:hypothetical protein